MKSSPTRKRLSDASRRVLGKQAVSAKLRQMPSRRLPLSHQYYYTTNMYSRIASHMQRTLFSTRSLICSSRILRGGCESSSPSVIRSRHYALAADPKSTVDVDEISHFSRLSSLWWDEHGECAQLHRMNPVRMQFIREKVVSSYCSCSSTLHLVSSIYMSQSMFNGRHTYAIASGRDHSRRRS